MKRDKWRDELLRRAGVELGYLSINKEFERKNGFIGGDGTEAAEAAMRACENIVAHCHLLLRKNAPAWEKFICMYHDKKRAEAMRDGHNEFMSVRAKLYGELLEEIRAKQSAFDDIMKDIVEHVRRYFQ